MPHSVKKRSAEATLSDPRERAVKVNEFLELTVKATAGRKKVAAN